MRVSVDLGFEQILKIVKALPKSKLELLKAELDNVKPSKTASKLETLLLSGPTATKAELKTIADNRKDINQWRTN